MTASTQEEIIQNTKTVVQGLDTLKSEHNSIHETLLRSLSILRDKNEEASLIEEKANLVEKSLENIELGIEEAQVSSIDR